MPKLRAFQIDTVELGADPDMQAALGGGALDELSDVTIATPLNGEVLTYNNGTSQWENTTHDAGITDHTLLSNIGNTTHINIDAHIGDTAIHFTQANIAITESQVSDLKAYIQADSWATETTGGTIKIRVTGTDAFITTDGTNP